MGVLYVLPVDMHVIHDQQQASCQCMVLVGALALTSASVLMQQACLDGGTAEARTRNTELGSGQCPMHGGAVMASDQQALGGNWGWAARRMLFF